MAAHTRMFYGVRIFVDTKAPANSSAPRWTYQEDFKAPLSKADATISLPFWNGVCTPRLVFVQMAVTFADGTVGWVYSTQMTGYVEEKKSTNQIN